jgi:hypothetical protein
VRYRLCRPELCGHTFPDHILQPKLLGQLAHGIFVRCAQLETLAVHLLDFRNDLVDDSLWHGITFERGYRARDLGPFLFDGRDGPNSGEAAAGTTSGSDSELDSSSSPESAPVCIVLR